MDLSFLYLVLYFVIALFAGGILFYGLLFGAMYMKIPTKKLKKIIELGQLSASKTVYDLGAGLGTIAFEAAYSGAHIVAVEVDPFKVALMKILLSYNNRVSKLAMNSPGAALMKPPKLLDVEVVKGNLMDADLREADVVYCYLFGPLMQKVGEKAKRELHKGALLISVEHPILDWKPECVDQVDKIFVYKQFQ